MKTITIKTSSAFSFKAKVNKRMSFKKGEDVSFRMVSDEAKGPFTFSLKDQEFAHIVFPHDCDTTMNKILLIARAWKPKDLTWDQITTRIYE